MAAQILYVDLEQKGMHVADDETVISSEMHPEQRGYIGELNYPKLKQTKKIILSKADRLEIERKILPNIEKIIRRETPPRAVEWKICKKCSYNELCYS